MNLLIPGLAVAGACAVAIPILIHLLARQRRKPIEWAAMKFLIEAFRKHKRRLQLEQLVLLAIRCLVVGLLGLALARPILEGAGLIEAGGARSIYLVLDDGLASGVVDPASSETALATQVKQAIELVNGLGPGDTVGVITAARPARGLLMPPSGDRAAVVDLLQSLAPKQSPSDLHAAIALVRSAVGQAKESGDRQTMVYLMSEFRAGSATLDAPLPLTNVDETDQVALLAAPPAENPVGNVQIMAINPVRSVVQPGATDGSDRVTVRLRRTGGAMSGDVTRVRLSADGLPAIAPRTVQWKPGQPEAEAEFIVDFNAGVKQDREIGLVAAIDDDALNADNTRQIVLEARSSLRVLMIDRRSFGFERGLDQLTAGQWIRRALEPLEKGPITVVEAEPAALDVADLRTTDVAILPRPDLITDAGWTLLQPFVRRGGLLIVMPPAEVNVHQWTTRMVDSLNLPWRLSLEAVDHGDGLLMAEEQPAAELTRLISSELAELGRPVVTMRSLPVERPVTQATTLLQFADGSPLLIVSGTGTGANGNGATTQPAEGVGPANPQAGDNRQPSTDNLSRGLVVYLAVAPELSWTSLPSKPLMVPLFHELIRQGLSVIKGSQKIMVGDQPALAQGAAARDLVGPSGQRLPLDSTGRAQQPIESSGLYGVDDPSGQPIGQVAVNIDPRAGQTDVQPLSAVQAWLKASGPWTTFDPQRVGATLGAGTTGSPISGMILMIVLGLVILETILARLFSHAYRDERVDARVLTT